MTEPENFEDDLFADLYNDDDAGGAAAGTKTLPGNDQPVEPRIESPAKDTADYEASGGDDYQHEGEADEDMRHDEVEYDDEDEVDFNLGGPTSNGYSHQDDAASGAGGSVGGSYSKPSAKEDG